MTTDQLPAPSRLALRIACFTLHGPMHTWKRPARWYVSQRRYADIWDKMLGWAATEDGVPLSYGPRGGVMLGLTEVLPR